MGECWKSGSTVTLTAIRQAASNSTEHEPLRPACRGPITRDSFDMMHETMRLIAISYDARMRGAL